MEKKREGITKTGAHGQEESKPTRILNKNLKRIDPKTKDKTKSSSPNVAVNSKFPARCLQQKHIRSNILSPTPTTKPEE